MTSLKVLVTCLHIGSCSWLVLAPTSSLMSPIFYYIPIGSRGRDRWECIIEDPPGIWGSDWGAAPLSAAPLTGACQARPALPKHRSPFRTAGKGSNSQNH